MSSGFVVMTALEDGVAKCFVIRDIHPTLVGENSSLGLPVREAGVEWEGNILVYGLESLEDKRVTGRGGFNAVGRGPRQ